MDDRSVSSTAAIFFDPDGYVLTGPKLMGRQAAGNAFLRAAVAGREGQPLWVYAPHPQSAEVFGQLIRDFDPQAEARWIAGDRTDLLAELGTLYFPGPGLGGAARLRLRQGPAAYSLVGVTHTTASHIAMDDITQLLAAPVMPWDALICTSSAVGSTVKALLEAELDYLRWRFGPNTMFTLPQLPVIPLGVHCDDFVFTPAERMAARRELGIAEDEVVALFVGRLSFHAKAHPHAMYSGLQAAAERTGKKIVLVQSGWFANEAIAAAFEEGAQQFCPKVRPIFSDGKKPEAVRRSWAAADLFVSLSDNIQETFGLTPVEAMAAGLPVVVTDWNGYKDTVRDGVDGFRIPTWMPPPDLGEPYARAYEAGVDSYDFYCGLTCQTVSVDLRALGERLGDLVGNPALRERMGQAGRARARERFDWAVVYRQYRTLWTQLGEIRRAAAGDPARQAALQAAPRVAPNRMDPFRSFGHYPTAVIQPDTWSARLPGSDGAVYRELIGHGLYRYADKVLPAPDVAEKLLAALGEGGLRMRELAERAGFDLGGTALAMSVLAKMGLVSLSASPAADGAADSSEAEFLALLPPTGRAVLEIGCGEGRRGRAHRARNPAVRYLGVERQERAGREAARHLDHVIIGDIEQPQALAALDKVRGDLCFDALVLADVLESLHDPLSVLAELRGRTAAGAVCVARVPNVAHWSVVTQQLRGHWDYAGAGLPNPGHLRFFTRATVIDLFRQAGWQVLDAKPVIPWPEQTRNVIETLEPVAAGLGIAAQDLARELSAYQWIIRAVNEAS
jgi:starch synthase